MCFGSKGLRGDDIALRFASKAKVDGVEFVACRAPDEILEYYGKDFVILDAAQGIRTVRMLTGLSALKTGKLVSLHDFDLGFFLKVAARTGRRQRVRIVAIPLGMGYSKALPKVRELLAGIGSTLRK